MTSGTSYIVVVGENRVMPVRHRGPNGAGVSALWRGWSMGRRACLAVCALLLTGGMVATAATLDWDPGLSGGTALGGSGTWNDSNLNWWNGSANVAWTDGSTARFASPSTVTISGSRSAVDLDVTGSSGDVILTGGTLALTGGEITATRDVRFHGSITINAPSGMTWNPNADHRYLVFGDGNNNTKGNIDGLTVQRGNVSFGDQFAGRTFHVGQVISADHALTFTGAGAHTLRMRGNASSEVNRDVIADSGEASPDALTFDFGNAAHTVSGDVTIEDGASSGYPGSGGISQGKYPVRPASVPRGSRRMRVERPCSAARSRSEVRLSCKWGPVLPGPRALPSNASRWTGL